MPAIPEQRDPYILASYGGEKPPAPDWFTTAIKNAPERSFFTSDGANIELLTWGERGLPGLLFVHGNGAHADWWSHIAPHFSEHWRCAAFSFSGMGCSDRRPGGYTIPDLARETLGAVSAAGLDAGPAAPIVIGHSFGGSIALEAAVMDKTAFSGVITIDTPLNLDPEQLELARGQAQKRRDKHRVFPTFKEGLAGFRLAPPQDCGNDFVADHIARQSLVEAEGGWTWHFDPQRVTIDTERDLDATRRLACPAVYFYGDRSVLVTQESLPRALDVLPEGTPAIPITDAAHHVMVDQPLALVAALRTLLATWPDNGA